MMSCPDSQPAQCAGPVSQAVLDCLRNGEPFRFCLWLSSIPDHDLAVLNASYEHALSCTSPGCHHDLDAIHATVLAAAGEGLDERKIVSQLGILLCRAALLGNVERLRREGLVFVEAIPRLIDDDPLPAVATTRGKAVIAMLDGFGVSSQSNDEPD
jgi:hypothetical protein